MAVEEKKKKVVLQNMQLNVQNNSQAAFAVSSAVLFASETPLTKVSTSFITSSDFSQGMDAYAGKEEKSGAEKYAAERSKQLSGSEKTELGGNAPINFEKRRIKLWHLAKLRKLP